MNNFIYQKFFPYSTIRDQQKEAIEFALDAFTTQNKRFVIIEAGTGVGKSAVGLAVARYLNSNILFSDDYTSGAYFSNHSKNSTRTILARF